MSFAANSIWVSNKKEYAFSKEDPREIKIHTHHRTFEALDATRSIFIQVAKYYMMGHIPDMHLFFEKNIHHGRIMSHGQYITIVGPSSKSQIHIEKDYGMESHFNMKLEGVRIR